MRWLVSISTRARQHIPGAALWGGCAPRGLCGGVPTHTLATDVGIKGEVVLAGQRTQRRCPRPTSARGSRPTRAYAIRKPYPTLLPQGGMALLHAGPARGPGCPLLTLTVSVCCCHAAQIIVNVLEARDLMGLQFFSVTEFKRNAPSEDVLPSSFVKVGGVYAQSSDHTRGGEREKERAPARN